MSDFEMHAGILSEVGGAKPQLERVIGVGGVALTAFNTIVGSGIFAVPALAAALLGPAAIVAYAICAALIGLIGLCFAEAGSRVSSAGGLYAYASAAFGPIGGGVVGTLLWSANSVVPSAAISNFFIEALSAVVPALATPLNRALALAIIYFFLAAANVRGTRSGAHLVIAMALIKLVPLILLIAAGMFAIHTPNLRVQEIPSVATIGQGAVLLFFAFMGIEGGLGTSGEVKNPARTIPRAIFVALTLVATLYISLQLVAQGVLGSNLAASKLPLTDAATDIFGPWGARLFVCATILSAAGYLVADMLSSPRTLYALAECGQLPRALSAVHPRFGTPWVAIITYAILAFVMALSGSFRQLLIVASSGTLILYLIVCLGLLRLRARNTAMAGKPFRAPGGAFVPLAASAIIIWMLSTLAWSELFAALGIVVVASVCYTLHSLSNPSNEKKDSRARQAHVTNSKRSIVG